VTTTGNASFVATNAITLNDNGTDVLSVAGNASFKGSTIDIGPAGGFNALSLTFDSVGNVTIQEDSATEVTGTNKAAVLSLTSGGAITDAVGTSVTTTGSASFIATDAITLNDNGTDVLSVAGNASFKGSAIDIGPAGSFNAASLTFDSVGNVTIQEDSATEVTGINTAAVLSLTSASAITDAAGTSVTTTGNASFVATNAITLNDNGTDVLSVAGNASFRGSAINIGPAGSFNAVSLTFDSTGNVTIQEDSATEVTGTNKAAVLSLTSAGAITDAAGTSVTTTGNASFTATDAITLNDNGTDVLSVAGNASFKGSAIDIGPAGSFNALSLTFDSIGNVTIQEDSATELSGTNKAAILSLTSAGAITDAAGTSVTTTGNASFTATDAITLNDNGGDVLSVAGNANFKGSAISIGSAGTFNALSLTFDSAGNVTIQEDSATEVTGTNKAAVLSLTSAGAITDAAGTSVTTTGNASFTATDAITLNDDGSDVLSVAGNASFKGSAINVGPAGTFNALSLTFDSTGNVTIQEDSDSELTGTNKAAVLSLTSAGAITDASGTSVTTTGNASFKANDAITLNDNGTDVLTVAGNASFTGTIINVGPTGTFNAQSLTFNSSGNTTIQEDSDTDLQGVSIVGSIAQSDRLLKLTSAGSITDTVNATRPVSSLTVFGDAELTAGANISLTDVADSQIDVKGLATFITSNSVTVGGPGVSNFGSISIYGSLSTPAIATATATIFEDSDSQLMQVRAGTLNFDSKGYIKNLKENEVFVSGTATLSAAEYIHLGRVDIAKVSAVSKGVSDLGLTQTADSTLANPKFLYQLNQTADDKGSSAVESLEAFSAHSATTQFIGKSEATLRKDFSYIESYARSYGLFISNNRALEVVSLTASDPLVVGEPAPKQPNIYVETLDGDITVTGAVTTVSSDAKNGGVILVADQNLKIQGAGVIETQQVSNPAALQRVLSNQLAADAMDGGDGRDVWVTTKYLYYGTQSNTEDLLNSKRHQIATTFGQAGEIGFQFVVQYGDAAIGFFNGVVRAFGNKGEVSKSSVYGTGEPLVPSVPNSTPILAHVDTGVLATTNFATFLRNAGASEPNLYYNQFFLATNPVIESTVVMRRSTDFFLFADGGASDLATVVDRTTVEDTSISYSGSPMIEGMTMPEDYVPMVIIDNTVQVVLPIDTSYNSFLIDYDPPKALSSGDVEVAIYKVKFDDLNGNGQVDEGEEPSAEEILDPKQDRIMRETKDTKGAVAPTPEQIRQWQSEYEKDPTKTSGSYSVIGTDRLRGEVVFGTFIIRDAAEDNTQSNESPEPEANGNVEPSKDSGAYLPNQTLPLPAVLESMPRSATMQQTVGVHDVRFQMIQEFGWAQPSSENKVDNEMNPVSEDFSPVASSVALGSLLWLKGFRERRSSDESTDNAQKIDYSRVARKWRRFIESK
jgi:hypothetical protein